MPKQEGCGPVAGGGTGAEAVSPIKILRMQSRQGAKAGAGADAATGTSRMQSRQGVEAGATTGVSRMQIRQGALAGTRARSLALARGRGCFRLLQSFKDALLTERQPWCTLAILSTMCVSKLQMFTQVTMAGAGDELIGGRRGSTSGISSDCQ